MTLQDLFDNGVTLQGNIRLSVYPHNSKNITEIKGTHDLELCGLDEEMKGREITYMYCPGDGYLHIELEEESD